MMFFVKKIVLIYEKLYRIYIYNVPNGENYEYITKFYTKMFIF